MFSVYAYNLPNVFPLDVICQMYADDVVLYVHAKSRQQAAQKLTDHIMFTSNVKKTVCMFFLLKGQIMK